jgi:hypothetical protein
MAKKRTRATKRVITLKLTEEQQERIRRESGGALKIEQLRIRPDLNIPKILEDMAKIGRTVALTRAQTKLAPPPPKDLWV